MPTTYNDVLLLVTWLAALLPGLASAKNRSYTHDRAFGFAFGFDHEIPSRMSATRSDKHSSKYQENSPSKKNWRYEQVASPLFDQNPISPADLIPPSASDLAHALRQERRANAAKYASEEVVLSTGFYRCPI